MKKLFPWAALLLATVLMSACTSKAPLTDSASDPVNIVFATDLHYLSPALTDNGEGFMARMYNSDGKAFRYIDQITEAMVSELIADPPDALVLGGDLTLDGEKQSHLDLSVKLKRLHENGIPVLVIPGNHDIDNFRASSFTGNDRNIVETIDKKTFVKLYGDLSYKDAAQKDKDSLSYVYPLRSDLWVLLLDVNEGAVYGGLSDNSYIWLEEQLKAAKEQGVTVLSVSHQNVLPHNPIITDNYIIEGNDRLIALLEQYGVPLNLSGHIHLQHTEQSSGGFREVTTSSMAITPTRCGVVTFDGGTMNYTTRNINVEGWAQANAITDGNLLAFDSFSRGLFWDIAYYGCKASLDDGWGIPETDTAQMAEFYADVNTCYFRGEKTTRTKDEPAFALWERYEKEGFRYKYIVTMLESTVEDHTQVTIEVGE